MTEMARPVWARAQGHGPGEDDDILGLGEATLPGQSGEGEALAEAQGERVFED